MKTAQEIKTAIERSVKALELKPALGLKNKRASARLVNGLTCEVKAGDWTLTSDMPPMAGGNDTGPTPGDFSRMGLASCMAIGYASWFAREEMPCDQIEVEVETDVDYGQMFGANGGVVSGHKALTVHVHVESPAPRSEIERVLDLADQHSPVLYSVTQPTTVTRELHLTEPARAAAAAAAAAR
jgi:uncharacterized OsmC-like protein